MDEIVEGIRKFRRDTYPQLKPLYDRLVSSGQKPRVLMIGCSDSRVAFETLTGRGPGELFIVRNVGAFIPPHDGSHGLHGTMAAIEFAVLNLRVERIIVCGHSHCGAIRAAYEGAPQEAVALHAWLKLASEALLPVQPGPEAFRRTEQRAVVLQLERLMGYPMVRRQVEAGALSLHGWHYVIEDGEIHVFDALQGGFLPASVASNSGTGPYQPYVEHDGQVIA